MKNFRNIFLWIGLVAIVVMLVTMDTPYAEIWAHVQTAGWWFVAVVLLWLPIYLLNAWSWSFIIHAQAGPRVPFLRVFRYTISGYALNYVTPVGVLGGEPYRIMELSGIVGSERATSSVLLYAMMHIFSHFLFWAASILLFLLCHSGLLTPVMAVLLGLVALFCGLGIYFFLRGYRNGFAFRAMHLLTYIPLVGKWARRLVEQQADTIHHIDQQIAALHQCNRWRFYGSLFLEFLARVVGCLELWFILMILTDSVRFVDCILIQAFTSLFANLLFFMPMEMGTREGGFALAVGGLVLPATFGVLAGLLTRLREIIWIAVGLALIKVQRRQE